MAEYPASLPDVGPRYPTLEGDELDVHARSVGQRLHVAGISGQDVVPVGGKAYHHGVDRIGQATPAALDDT